MTNSNRTKKTPNIQRIITIAIVTISINSMLIQSANSLRVAVLGSGIAGSTAARSLADRGVEVTVFESGFGVGGRTSTRVVTNDDEFQYQFDHGAQYIGTPKTEVFRTCLESWKNDGFVKEWSGKFASVDGTKITHEVDKKQKRWVGYPRMNSISTNLLNHPNIRVETDTRADATQRYDTGKGWHYHLKKGGKTKKDLGTFDWLVQSDRNSGAHHRKDLRAAKIDEFTARGGLRDIQSIKSLTAMVVFDKPLNIQMDGVQFTGKDVDQYGSLGWVARDTSKPGRERTDTKECWVLQTHPEAANKLLKGMRDIDEIREMARDVLVDDFLKSIPHLRDTTEGMVEDVDISSVEFSLGHRWGAAFPIPSQEFTEKECYVRLTKQFAACGDYFGKYSGRIEGAYLSGRAAAEEILQLI